VKCRTIPIPQWFLPPFFISSIANLFKSSLTNYSLDQYTEEQKAALVDCCPTEVFAMEEHSGAVVITDVSACIFCKECIYTLEDFRRSPEDKLAVEVRHSPDRFTFTVETTGALYAKEVVQDALVQLTEKLGRLIRAIPKLLEL
jgi:NAD-dependent dihydropyrimidine dehydrogenase PreA subunit